MDAYCDEEIRKQFEEILEQNKIVVVSLPGCPPCKKAKELLKTNDIPFHDINIHEREGYMECIYNKTRSQYAPQIFVKSNYIGGYQQLHLLHSSGKLQDKLI
jgi:glutaredoxin 3